MGFLNGNVMIPAGLKAAAASPSLVSQYGPLIVATITLAGVLVTLAINGQRDRRRDRRQRRDEYKKTQRDAIAAIAVAGHNFRREYGALIDSSNWSSHRTSAEAARATLLNELTVARLLIADPTLQGALDDVSRAWKAVGETVDQAPSSFMTGPMKQAFAETLTKRLYEFDVATQELYTAALDGLKPSAAEDA